ncbi:hypothetical protein Z950_927 [Sulfitobacter mediterraneus KCTC 32188]|nr:hypothetical protein Z950_927 [Sulfitobacter mediterraneus KCTC 32188]
MHGAAAEGKAGRALLRLSILSGSTPCKKSAVLTLARNYAILPWHEAAKQRRTAVCGEAKL